MTNPTINIAKPFTPAEKERLIEVVTAANAAVAEQDKWVAFLRKQHNAPVEWGITFEGFVAPPAKEDGTPPAPDSVKTPPKLPKKAQAKAN